MIQADPIEAVLESEDSLDFVGFDHGVKNVANGERFLFGSGEIVSQS